MAGSTIVIVRNSANLVAVWNDPTGLSYDPSVSQVLLPFGISKHNVEKIYLPDPGSLIKAENRDQSPAQFQPAEKMLYVRTERVV